MEEDTTFIVDEIERSIHPILIKRLISKIASNKEIKGQLIFTTHESNLLDKSIFRQDEIWFAEKNKQGESFFSPLSDYKIGTEANIEKGYIGGRFGGIPFLGDLEALDFNKKEDE